MVETRQRWKWTDGHTGEVEMASWLHKGEGNKLIHTQLARNITWVLLILGVMDAAEIWRACFAK